MRCMYTSPHCTVFETGNNQAKHIVDSSKEAGRKTACRKRTTWAKMAIRKAPNEDGSKRNPPPLLDRQSTRPPSQSHVQ